MPNHVHLLMTPLLAVSKVMQSLKRFTAREGNRIRGVGGRPFWQDESYDRLVRNDTEFARITHYIETNPVKAGLAATPEEFRWSSARPIDNRPHVSASADPDTDNARENHGQSAEFCLRNRLIEEYLRPEHRTDVSGRHHGIEHRQFPMF